MSSTPKKSCPDIRLDYNGIISAVTHLLYRHQVVHQDIGRIAHYEERSVILGYGQYFVPDIIHLIY